MGRKLIITSSLSPEQVLAALSARGNTWRESEIPDDLRRIGVLCIHVQTKGPAFTTWFERSTTDRMQSVDCRGTVVPTASGSRIDAVLRRTPDGLIIIPLFWLLSGWWALRGNPKSIDTAIGVSLFILCLWGFVWLITDRRVATEHQALRIILERAARGDTSPLTSQGVAA